MAKSDIWYYWAGADACTSYTTTSVSTPTATTWYKWTTTPDWSTTSDNDDTWVYWTTSGNTTGGIVSYTPPAPTPEQEQQWAAEHERVRVAAEEQAKLRAQARDRAKALLATMLSDAQRDQLAKHKHFDIVSQKGNRYRIHEGSHGNVKLLDDTGKVTGRYCGQPNNVPIEDSMLAQKLQLEYDEDEYVRRSNFTRM